MADWISRDRVIGFRLAAHNLTARLDEDRLIDAAGRCGVQDSPPGSALLALHARVVGVTRERLAAAIGREKSLLQTWCMRGAPFSFPTVDAPVFTTGVLPADEQAMRHLIPGVEQAVDSLGMSLSEAVELTAAEIREVLTGRALAITELGAEVAQRIASELPSWQRERWEQEGPYAAGQPLGEAVVHFCLRILTLRQLVCFAPRTGNKAPFVLVDEWLGGPLPQVDPATARAELLRRYLHCYGPSTRADFAAWLGLRARDVAPWWNLVEDEVAQVEFAGKAWMLAEDLGALRSAAMPSGVRLLPPRDPYTQLRDRHTVVDPDRHRAIWKTIGEPGAVLVDGEIAGSWR
ncbi:MAG: winged helix DNA-binding domain-containing protein, partial [Propionicimonas sp.]|nr:winged helix DNA-binding domain-containing protein [Propionicimonas sp.]